MNMGVSSSLRNSALKQLQRNVESRGLALTMMPANKKVYGLEGIPTYLRNMRKVEVAHPFILVKPYTVTAVMTFLGNRTKKFKYLSPVTLQDVLSDINMWNIEVTGHSTYIHEWNYTFSIDGMEIGNFDDLINVTDWKSRWKLKSKITRDMTIALNRQLNEDIPDRPAFILGPGDPSLSLTGRDTRSSRSMNIGLHASKRRKKQ
jgi:hypothetical protein